MTAQALHSIAHRIIPNSEQRTQGTKVWGGTRFHVSSAAFCWSSAPWGPAGTRIEWHIRHAVRLPCANRDQARCTHQAGQTNALRSKSAQRSNHSGSDAQQVRQRQRQQAAMKGNCRYHRRHRRKQQQQPAAVQRPTFGARLQIGCAQFVRLCADLSCFPVLLAFPRIGGGAVQPCLHACHKREPEGRAMGLKHWSSLAGPAHLVLIMRTLKGGCSVQCKRSSAVAVRPLPLGLDGVKRLCAVDDVVEEAFLCRVWRLGGEKTWGLVPVTVPAREWRSCAAARPAQPTWPVLALVRDLASRVVGYVLHVAPRHVCAQQRAVQRMAAAWMSRAAGRGRGRQCGTRGPGLLY